MSKTKEIKIAEPQIGSEEENAVLKVLRSRKLSQGEKVAEFEILFSKYIGTKYAVAVSNGTCALHLSLLALGIGKGDEVITTPFSFIATANAIRYTDATPIFSEIDPHTFNIDPKAIEKKITRKTKAIMPVHLFGLPSEMDDIIKIAKKHKLFLIEDAAQAHGAKYKGKKVGSFGVGCFSFYSTKNMTTGEGGMITTNSKSIYEKLLLLRSHGMKRRYYNTSIGFNFRMTDIQASIGIEQLKKLPTFNKKRVQNAAMYSTLLKNVSGVFVPEVFGDKKHVYHQYSILFKNKKVRDSMRNFLSEHGVQSETYYPLPINEQVIYKGSGSFLIAHSISQRILSLPVHPGVNEKDITYICDLISSFLSNKS